MEACKYSKKENIEIYFSLVLSKLLNGLQTAWLSKNMRKRLDGCHCACSRKIIEIPHFFISRITNAEVSRQANEGPLQNKLLKQQLLLYGNYKRNIIHPIHDEVSYGMGKKRRGRPLLNWHNEIDKHVALMISNSSSSVYNNIFDAHRWRKGVNEYCNRS